MKTFKQFSAILEARFGSLSGTKPRIRTAPADIGPQVTPNLPAVRKPSVPVLRGKPEVERLRSRANELKQKSKELVPYKEKPVAKPEQQKSLPTKVEPKAELLPKEKTTAVTPVKRREGQTFDQKPETKTSTKAKTLAKTATATATALAPSSQTKTQTKTQTQTQPQRRKILPTTPATTDTGAGKPPGGGKGGGPVGGGPLGGGKGPGGPGGAGKSPFIATPPGDRNGGAGRPSEPDPNAPGGPGGFVTAGVSKGPKGELRTVNVARGKVDEPALPHKETGLDIPLQKASNVPYVAPKFWKQASSAETTGTKLPPQGSKDRDAELKAKGYTKF